MLLGFGVVSLPLLIAIAYAVLSFEQWAHDSQQAVQRANQAALASRQFTEALLGMERSLRQYFVLHDPVLLDDFVRLRGQLHSGAERLGGMALPNDAHRRLAGLLQREAVFSDGLTAAIEADTSEAIIGRFQNLADEALPVVDAARGVADTEVAQLQAAALAARNAIWLPVLAAFATAFGLAWWFRNRIAAQMRQLDHAIRTLGKAEYEEPITVTGPDDVAFLGRRLDWLRRRLAELEAHQSRFLRHVSHDLKTPLTALREGSQLLADEVAGPLSEQQRHVVGILTQNGLRLQALIEDLLNFQQASMAARSLDLQRVSMARVVEQVLEAQRLAAKARGIRFERALAPVTLTGDQDKLRVVVDNLIGNAVKHSPDQGIVTVTVSAVKGRVVVEVSDQGPGIPAGEREQVFDAFFRGTRSGQSSVKGSGLGLAIAHEYVAAHQGRLELLDRDEPGAHFRVVLPMAQKESLA